MECFKLVCNIHRADEALEQMKLVLEEDRAHQDWVENQEKVWKESKEKDEPMVAKKEAAATGMPHRRY